MPDSALAMLRDAGHDALTIRQLGLATAPDEDVFAAAQHEGRVLITKDLDFGRIFIERGPSVSIVVLRPENSRGPAATALLRGFLAKNDLGAPELQGCLIVVRAHGHRVRRSG